MTKQTHEHSATPPRNPHGEFISNTERLLTKVSRSRDAALLEFKALRVSAERFKTELLSALTNLASTNVPDLSAATLSKLKVSYPGFVTDEIKRRVQTTVHIDIPWGTWIWGESAEYKRKFISRVLSSIRSSFVAHVSQLKPRPALLKEITDLEAKISENSQKMSAAKTKFDALDARATQLEAVYRQYSRPGAEAPSQKLNDAMKEGSLKAQDSAHQNNGGTQTVVVHEDNTLSNLLLWDILTRPSHYHDEGHRQDTPTHTWGGGENQTSSKRDDSGGGFKMQPEEKTTEDSGGAIRMQPEERTTRDSGGAISMAGNESPTAEVEDDTKSGNDAPEDPVADEPDESTTGDSTDSDSGGNVSSDSTDNN